MNLILPDVNLSSLLPELILLAGATLLLFIRGGDNRQGIVPVAVLSVIAALAAVCYLWDQGTSGFGGLIVKDNGALLFQGMILTTALISLGDAIAAGHISNMYDIVETMAGAGRLLRP